MNFPIKEPHKSNFLFLSALCVFLLSFFFFKCCFKLNKLFEHLPPSSLSLSLFFSRSAWAMKYATNCCCCFFCLKARSHFLQQRGPGLGPFSLSGSPWRFGRPPLIAISSGDWSPHLQRSCPWWPQKGAAPVSNTVPESPAVGGQQTFFSLFPQTPF